MRMKSTSKTRPNPAKHIPQRTCVACRQVKAKRELIRIVRTPENDVEIDAGEKKAGRGAYLCRERRCWEAGLKGNRLEHALRGHLSRDNRERLIEYARDLRKGVH